MEKFALSSLWANNSGSANPWADSAVMPSAKVIYRPLSKSVLRTRISLGIHVHTIGTHAKCFVLNTQLQ